MKESGIVRKLDNLGRLVIPKEIRRCMRIKEGSSIEFSLLEGGEIVLSKYSLVSQISDFADEFCGILGDIFDCIVMVSDRDKIISSSGISKKTTIGAKLSSDILDIMDAKNTYSACVKDGTTIVKLMENDICNYTSQVICPISIQGDIEGVVILADTKSDRCFGIEHVTSLLIVTKFISKQME